MLTYVQGPRGENSFAVGWRRTELREELHFPAQQTQGLAEVWVPFEELIAVGWG